MITTQITERHVLYGVSPCYGVSLWMAIACDSSCYGGACVMVLNYAFPTEVKAKRALRCTVAAQSCNVFSKSQCDSHADKKTRFWMACFERQRRSGVRVVLSFLTICKVIWWILWKRADVSCMFNLELVSAATLTRYIHLVSPDTIMMTSNGLI